MGPDLVSGRVQVNTNGHDTVDNNGGGDYNSAALKSSDFKSINSRDHSNSMSKEKKQEGKSLGGLRHLSILILSEKHLSILLKLY